MIVRLLIWHNINRSVVDSFVFLYVFAKKGDIEIKDILPPRKSMQSSLDSVLCPLMVSVAHKKH